MKDLFRRLILPFFTALVLTACPEAPVTKGIEPALPKPPTDERPDPVPHPDAHFDEIPPVTGWGPVAEPIIDWGRFREPDEPDEPDEPHQPTAPRPEPEQPAPVDHPGQPPGEIQALGSWVPFPEPVIDWGQFLMPPTEPHEPGPRPQEPEEPEDPEGLPPEYIEDTCRVEVIQVWDAALGRLLPPTERVRGPNEYACCVAMLTVATQPRAPGLEDEGRMCGCACDKETDTCTQMTYQPPHHSNPDNRGGLVCALAGPFESSVVDDLFKEN